MSTKPAWHVTRMGRVADQVRVGVKRPRADTAQVRAVNSSQSKNSKPIEHVTPAPRPDTLAHVLKCRSDVIGHYLATVHKSKDIQRTSVVYVLA